MIEYVWKIRLGIQNLIVSTHRAGSWQIVPNAVVTNTPSNTYCRAPGSTQGHAIIENIMEHVATAAGFDPLEFRYELLPASYILFATFQTSILGSEIC